MAFRFFLSYARIPAQRDEVEEFFNDLQDAVAVAIGRDGGDPGYFDSPAPKKGEEDKRAFIDVEIEAGRMWRTDIEDAIRTSKSMVALLSADYVNSDYCGREFAAFGNRLKRAKVNRPASDLFIPVRWSDVKSMPDALAEFQNDNSGYPRSYQEYGLLKLKKRQMYADDYHEVVETLAKMIASRTAGLIPDANAIPALQDTPNAFRLSSGVPEVGPLGPKNAKFVYIVAEPRELENVRKGREGYDKDGGYFWCPYHPPEKPSIGEVVGAVAQEMKVRPWELVITSASDLLTKIETAITNKSPVAVLIDPWSLSINRYDSLVRAIGKFAAEHPEISEAAGTFVPWNKADRETQDSLAALEQQVDVTFADGRPKYHYPRIGALLDLRSALIEFLQAIRFKVFEKDPTREVQEGSALHTISAAGGSTP
ncbi:MAG: hypothetical protein QOI58_312 [Thermoanaerobaculia bacterium]|jgi:FxsC-like protein|nr:hypothetical protein [Thermoanaerobaculia bacterium]